MTGTGNLNKTIWGWDGGTSTGVPSVPSEYTSFRTDRSMELQFNNHALRLEAVRLRRDLKAEIKRRAEETFRSQAVNNALLDEVEALHFELETLRQALTEALK